MTLPKNGSIHGMSLLVGELKGAIEHLNNNFKMKDKEAVQQRQELHRKFDALRDDVQEVKGDVANVQNSVMAVQQDVAEMKNDAEVVKATLEEYQINKVVAEVAIKDVGNLKDFMQNFEKKEQFVLGWADAAKKIGWFGWSLIAGFFMLAGGGLVAAFVQLILPRWL